jgi:methylmalonyl-CoA/ethylmalonyl-CoA epimerase
MKHQGLDHIAIVVKDTDEALKTWHHGMGLPLLHSEVVNGGSIRLTHLDLGNTHLQLVQPLTPDHPLQTWLKENGSGLHHFCLKVENVSDTKMAAPFPCIGEPHQGIQGKRAIFIDKKATNNTQVELTGK